MEIMSVQSSSSTSIDGCSDMEERLARERERLRVAQKRLNLQKERLVLDREMLEADKKNFRKTAKLASKRNSMWSQGLANAAAGTAERDTTRQVELGRDVETLRSQIQSYREKEEQWEQRDKEQTKNLAAAEVAVIESSRQLNLKILNLERDLKATKDELVVSTETHAKEKERWENGILEFVKSDSSADEEIQRLNLLVDKFELENKLLKDANRSNQDVSETLSISFSALEGNAEMSEALQKEWRKEKENLESRIRDQNQEIENWKLLVPRNKILLEQTQSKNQQLVKELEESQSRTKEQAEYILELEYKLKAQQQEQEMQQQNTEEETQEEMDTISLDHEPIDTSESATTNTLLSSHPGVIMIPSDFTSEQRKRLEKKFVIEWEWTNHETSLGGLYTGWLDLEGNPCGNGTLRIDDGGIYIGEWKRGLRTGIGVYTSIDGALYSGPWLNDKFQGRGVFVSEDNKVYTGDWTNGLRHGTGIETWEHGDRYIGQYYLDKENGRGTYTYPPEDGKSLGIQEQDRPDADRRQVFSDGSVLRDSEWSIGAFVGS